MKTKIKLCALIFVLLCMAIILMPNQVLATGVTEVANLAELQAALADETITGDIKVTNTIKIEESITINGNNKTIISEITKPFEIHDGTVEFKYITIINSASNGRCIDVRDGDVTLTLTGVTLKTTNNSTNNQTLNVGGNFTGPAVINLKDTTISAGKSGYGIITFNPVNLTIDNSDITGYSALYMKGQVNSAGSAGSNVTVNNSTLTGENNFEVSGSNSFATFFLEDTDINVSVENSNVLATGEGSALQLLFWEASSLKDSEKGNTISISGSSVLTAQEYLGLIVNSNTKIVLNSGVTSNIEIPEEVLPTGAVVKQENGKYVVYVPHDIEVSQGVEGGTVEVDKASAIAGETVTIKVNTNEGYQLKSLKAYTAAESEIEVVDGKFVMPNLGVIVEAEFEKIKTEVDYVVPEDKIENNNIGIVGSETAKETLDTSLKADTELNQKVEEATKNGETVTVEIKIEALEKDNVKEEEKQKILQTVSENQTIHQYFDISVLVTTDQKELGKITQLTEKMKFSIEISEDLIQEGRKFYILKLHGDEVERIEATLNGTNLEFETDQFSTFALAYEDGVEEDKTETLVSGEKDDTPTTGVINIPAYVWISLAAIALVGIMTTKKPSKHSK